MIYSISLTVSDVIFSLPAIKANGGGVIYLKPSNFLSLDDITWLLPLLKTQSYISKCAIHKGEQIDFDLDVITYEMPIKGTSRVDQFAIWLNVDLKKEPWIESVIDGKYPLMVSIYDGDLIYHPDFRPPFGILNFIGKKHECAFLKQRFHADVKHISDDSALDASNKINSCDHFIGTQNRYTALAFGLGKSVELLEDLYCPVFPYDRNNRV